MLKSIRYITFLIALLMSVSSIAQVNKAPAYPLITHDPYFSIWSMTDTLNASPTRHWTGSDQPLTGYIKVDGEIYRVIGNESRRYESVLPTSEVENYSVKYTESSPSSGWQNESFNEETWKTGKAPFSDQESTKGTRWVSKDLWVRRTFNLDKTDFDKLFLKLVHDDNVEVFLNGEEIFRHTGWSHKFQYFPIHQKLKKGKNVLAIHIANTAGGAGLDAGLVYEPELKENVNIIKAIQKNVTVNATQTIYDFTCGPVEAKVTFTSPLLIKDIELLSRPVSYVTYAVKSKDGKAHEVKLYFGISSDLATNIPSQEVVAKKYSDLNLNILKAGTKEQPVLQKKGDDLRIDWGYVYLATPNAAKAKQAISRTEDVVE